MIINKKGQIGATLSWFVAVLIIFFIMVLFLAATLVFSGTKKVYSGSDKIQLEKKISELNSYDILLNFLNKRIVFENEKSNIKETIIKGYEKEKRVLIQTKLKEELNKLIKENYKENSCYLFDIEYPDFNSNTKNKLDVCSFTCSDEDFNEYMSQYKLRLISKSISFDIYSSKGIIKIKFYLGDC